MYQTVLKQFLKNRTGYWVTILRKLPYWLFFTGTEGLIFLDQVLVDKDYHLFALPLGFFYGHDHCILHLRNSELALQIKNQSPIFGDVIHDHRLLPRHYCA
jgi:hypothetical protein